MIELVDDLGQRVRLAAPARRIASLVPSITETLFVLGAGERIAGVTEYCIHPAEGVRDKTKLGGTKTLRPERIVALAPDLVIANTEENRKHQVRELQEAGLAVFVTYPRTVEDAIKMMTDVAALSGTSPAAGPVIQAIREALADDELSIGDYVLTNGALPAMVVIDTVTRLLPGVLGDDASSSEESFSHGLLEYPQWTRPAEFRGMKVPEVLVSGNHAEIARWRAEQAKARTQERRPDLM